MEFDFLLLAGLSDLKGSDDVAERILNEIAVFKKENKPVFSNYTLSPYKERGKTVVEQLEREFPPELMMRPENKLLLSYIICGQDHDLDSLQSAVTEGQFLFRHRNVIGAVGGIAFRYVKPWQGNDLINISSGEDNTNYEVWDACVPDLCVRAVNAIPPLLVHEGVNSSIRLFVEPRLVDPSPQLREDRLYEFVGKIGVETVFYKRERD